MCHVEDFTTVVETMAVKVLMNLFGIENGVLLGVSIHATSKIVWLLNHTVVTLVVDKLRR